MKKLTALILSALLLTGCSAGASASYTQISQQEAMAIMEEETGYVILDVRTAGEYEDGHIPGAVNLPVDEVDAKAADLLTSKEQLILVYCRSGNRSKRASQILADQGYTNVKEFGGINTWPGEIQ